jgi:hypothetical protein
VAFGLTEKSMTTQDVDRCIDAVCALPRPQQAICVRLAAAAVLPIWQKWCKERRVKDLSTELLNCFDQWLTGETSDKELNHMAKRFHKALPKDIQVEPEPSAGYAGWALRDIPLIALGQCKDVHTDIVHTAICYAAAASCGIGPEAVWVRLDRLTEAELQFLKDWWERCRQQVPKLNSGG